MNEIKLIQSPVIAHKLELAGKEVDKRIAELNLENQIATVDTVKSLKDMRATLNKELESYEEQRKVIKKAILTPYDEFEQLYKTHISEKYNTAVNTLKTKITEVENGIRENKKKVIESYFNELSQFNGIDFITFTQTGIEINLSTTEKAYKEQCNKFIEKIVNDLSLIETEEHQAEIMAEFKKTLNASAAITSVRQRKEAEKLEAERIKGIRTAKRIDSCKKIGLVYVDITASYEFSDKIFIKESDVNELSDDDFARELAMCEEAIKLTKQNEDAPSPNAPISAPKVVEKEEIVTAAFKVTGTMAQLRSLGEFMKTNGITYQNIK